jgi:hypothetical protein
MLMASQGKPRQHFGVERTLIGFVGVNVEAEAVVITPRFPIPYGFRRKFPERHESM